MTVITGQEETLSMLNELFMHYSLFTSPKKIWPFYAHAVCYAYSDAFAPMFDRIGVNLGG